MKVQAKMSDDNTLRIKLSSYRCFYGHAGIEFSLEKGKTIAIVGKNNVGKSTLMRFFYELRYILSDFASGSWVQDGSSYVTRNNQSSALTGVQGLYGIGDAVQLLPKQSSEIPIAFSFEYTGFKCEFLVSKIAGQWKVQKQVSRIKEMQQFDAPLRDIFQRTLYIGAHRNLVNQSAGGTGYYDLSVGSAFVAEWDSLKNGTDIERARLAHQAEVLVSALLGWESIAISKSQDGTQLYVTNSKKGRFALTELGTGISELVLCIITATIKKPSWIFIDEPESHLHPSLQVKFLSALEQLASHGVVFTTHSIGLARATADSVLIMQQDDDGNSELRPFESAKNYSELLGELQFSQFHELGFNKILLCEGVTEIKALRQLLRLWALDSTVMLVPLGGNSLIDPKRVDELSEFNRFGVKIFVLIDSERSNAEDTASQRKKFISVCEDLFGVGHALQTARRAIENYFPTRAIHTAMRSEKYRSLEPFENGENIQPFWGKNQNWRITAEMNKDDLTGTDLAQFFEVISRT